MEYEDEVRDILENMGVVLLQFSALHIAKGCTDEEFNKKCDGLVRQALTKLTKLTTLNNQRCKECKDRKLAKI